jgi:hypothetical protein
MFEWLYEWMIQWYSGITPDGLVKTIVTMSCISIIGSGLPLIGMYRRKYDPTRHRLAFETLFDSEVTVIFMLIISPIAWVVAIFQHPKLRIEYLLLALGLYIIAVGVSLSRELLIRAPQLNRNFGKTWVKSLDFAYLGFGMFGLVRVINTSGIVDRKLDIFDTIGIASLASALGIRLSKSIIEVFFDSWLQTPVSRPSG